MAAGAYKGLTIRIGADTTKLSSALRGANSVIFKTQSQLTKLSKALKVDPGNTGVMTRQLGAASAQANSLASKMDNLRQGMAELGTTALKSDATKNVGQLAKETDNVALAAERALEKYNDLNKELSERYKPIADDTGIRLHESENVSPKQWDEDLTLVRQMGYITAEEELDIRKLHDAWMDARNAVEDYQNASDLDRMKNDLAATDAQLNAMARTYAKLSMKTDISKSFKGVDSQLRVMNSAAESASSRFERLNKSAELHPGSIGLAVERVKALSSATEIAQSKAELLKQKIAAYKADGIEQIAKGIDNLPKAFAEAEDNIAKAKRELDDYRERTDATEDEVRRLENALKDAEKAGQEVAKAQEFQELQDQLREVGDEAERMQKSLSGASGGTGIGAAAVTAATAIGDLMRDAGQRVVDSSNDIDKSYRDLRKTFDAEESDYQRLYDAAMQYSQSHTTNAKDMLEMEAIAAQLGVGLDGGADAIQHFAEVAANLDVATDIDSEAIALQMGQIVNVMDDLKPDNVERFGDALVRLGNNMPTQESNIMQISQRLSSVGNVAGFSTPEILGWAAAIASTGQRSEAAATGISNTITAIQSAVSRGGDDITAFAEVAGVTAEQFADAWRKSPSDALKMFIDGLRDAKEDAITKLEDVGIEGVRQTQTLLGLAQTSDNVTKAIQMAGDAFGDEANGIAAGGDAAEEANKKAQGFSGTLAKMQNSAQVLAAQFGDAMVPFMKVATDGLNVLSSLLERMSPAMKTFAVGVGGFFSAFAVGYPIISGIVTPLVELYGKLKAFGALKIGAFIAKFGSLGGFFSSIGSTLLTIGSAGTIAAGALGGLALVAGGIYVKKFLDAKKHGEDFVRTVGDIRDTTNGLHEELLFGKDSVKGYADSWSAAIPDMDKFLGSVQEHASAMQETRDSAGNTIAMLEMYRDIISRAAGAGDDYTGSMGELQWALDGLAEITGDTYSAEEILSGMFEGEAGNADKLRDSINQLIDAKKRESQLDAITNMRTEAVQGQMEAKEQMDAAAEAYRNRVESARKNYAGIIQNQFGGDWNAFVESDLDVARQIREREAAWGESKRMYDEWGEKIRTLDNEYDGLADEMAYLTSTAYGEREGIMQTNKVMKQALDAVGVTDEGIKQLASSIQDAGISTEEFKNIGEDAFAAIAKQSGGDIATMTEMLASFNDMGLSDKSLGIHVEDGELVDANNEIIEWNGHDWVWKETGVKVDVSQLPGARQQIDETTRSEDGLHDKDVTVTAHGNAATSNDPANKIDNTTRAARGLMSKDTFYRVYGNALDQATADAIWKVVAAANNLVSKTVELTTNIVTNTISNALNGKKGRKATGTYINPNKMPKHAAGIFTRPTLTNIGWVGEDGAELYSGNSLVPLTNRKYSMPYIDDISTAVARKLGAQSTGIDYDLLGQSVAAALVGMSVTIDGQALVGEIATQVQRTSRLYAG